MSVIFALQNEETAELMPGSILLNGLYEIVEPLQHGGFAMTYVARDSLERHVVIKECFPSGICLRSNGRVQAISPNVEAQFTVLKQQFLSEARGVAKLKHPHVVAVHQVFEENNTAYMALDYVAGMDLISVLEDEPERLTPSFFEATLRDTLKAVRHIHSKNILHRDIAPDNIRVDGSDRITLIDFGAAGTNCVGSVTGDGAVPSVKDGYSPPEFYHRGETQDFSSDLYSLAATFHHMITGDAPPDSQERLKALEAGGKDPYVALTKGDWACGYPVLATIDRVLSLPREDRLPSADAWLQALDEMPKVPPAQPKPVLVGPELISTISKLVQDVNKVIAATPDATARDAARKGASGVTKAKTKKKHWVDLIGNPIEDIADWAELEEDVYLQPVPQPTDDQVAAEPFALAGPELPARKSFLGGLFARILSRNPEACPT